MFHFISKFMLNSSKFIKVHKFIRNNTFFNTNTFINCNDDLIHNIKSLNSKTCISTLVNFKNNLNSCTLSSGLNGLSVQKRNFAGRQRGLKRSKHKKEPRRITPGPLRRLEFFYPKKAKQTRIRLVQNSRSHLAFDPVGRRFLAHSFRQGSQVFRSFGSRRNIELSKFKAINFISNNTNLYNTDVNSRIKLQPSCNLSGLRNIFFDQKNSSWVVCFKDSGIRRYRAFSVSALGFDGAYLQAIRFLRFSLFRNHSLLFFRHRTLKNRKKFII